MNLQKDDRTIKQDQKLYTEDEEYPWILGNPKRISRIRSLDVSAKYCRKPKKEKNTRKCYKYK